MGFCVCKTDELVGVVMNPSNLALLCSILRDPHLQFETPVQTKLGADDARVELKGRITSFDAAFGPLLAPQILSAHFVLTIYMDRSSEGGLVDEHPGEIRVILKLKNNQEITLVLDRKLILNVDGFLA